MSRRQEKKNEGIRDRIGIKKNSKRKTKDLTGRIENDREIKKRWDRKGQNGC